MAYNEEQLKRTMAYILEFFRSEIVQTKVTVIENNMSIFENHLKRIFFRELPQFKPDKFELKKIGSSEPYFIEWIDKHILPFPEDFSVILSNDGNSFAIYKGTKTAIFSPPASLNSSLSISSSTNLESVASKNITEYNIKSPSKAKSSLISEKINKNTLNTALKQEIIEERQDRELSEKERKEQERIFYNSCYEGLYEYVKYTPKKRGKINIIIPDTIQIDVNNIYADHENPKYDNKTGGMYIPIYKKNKYGDVYKKMRATVAETTSTSVTKPAIIPQKTELDVFQLEYEELTSKLKFLHVG